MIIELVSTLDIETLLSIDQQLRKENKKSTHVSLRRQADIGRLPPIVTMAIWKVLASPLEKSSSVNCQLV
ncbi:hypothetical protein BDV41DRAFT_531576 [Aspergillus transmontanensis]|uniref:Uncharacterized protein n=1 Tax=Aspergillus transmontanensis TaxID=1034304 RepID=A0A5N6W463_9EURO|nr:hypothetical protein BDV41DRAFT_531576 [Aspergillus transmontanensis]